jgi:hypothetical protein
MHQIACHLPLSFSFIYGTNSCYNLLNDNMRHLNWSAAPASPIYGRNIRFNSNYRIYVHIRLNINMVTYPLKCLKIQYFRVPDSGTFLDWYVTYMSAFLDCSYTNVIVFGLVCIFITIFGLVFSFKFLYYSPYLSLCIFRINFYDFMVICLDDLCNP